MHVEGSRPSEIPEYDIYLMEKRMQRRMTCGNVTLAWVLNLEHEEKDLPNLQRSRSYITF
jgi:hypothetical protein